MSFLEGKELLLTGGTGSLGKTLTKLLIKDRHKPRGIRIFSRDEYKQWHMKEEMADYQRAQGTNIDIAYIVGDVRNYQSMYRAFENVDIVINTAAMKQIPTCEANPLEAIQTNVGGVENVIKAALACDVSRIMQVSTDKAVHSINLYGATKAVGEKLIIHANVYSGRKDIAFSCCRYGNVLGSRGSIVPLFKQQIAKDRPVTVTDLRMTRFWITLPMVGRFLLSRIGDMKGREIYVPKMNALSVQTILWYLWNEKQRKEKKIEFIGIRPGEKMHECLIAPEEAAVKRITRIEMLRSFIGKNGQIKPEMALGDWYYTIAYEPNYALKPLYSNTEENYKPTELEFKDMLDEEV